MSILIIMAKLGAKSYRCERCFHEWTTRYDREPVQCPKCKSARWDEPKKE